MFWWKIHVTTYVFLSSTELNYRISLYIIHSYTHTNIHAKPTHTLMIVCCTHLYFTSESTNSKICVHQRTWKNISRNNFNQQSPSVKERVEKREPRRKNRKKTFFRLSYQMYMFQLYNFLLLWLFCTWLLLLLLLLLYLAISRHELFRNFQ